MSLIQRSIKMVEILQSNFYRKIPIKFLTVFDFFFLFFFFFPLKYMFGGNAQVVTETMLLVQCLPNIHNLVCVTDLMAHALAQMKGMPAFPGSHDLRFCQFVADRSKHLLKPVRLTIKRKTTKNKKINNKKLRKKNPSDNFFNIH